VQPIGKSVWNLLAERRSLNTVATGTEALRLFFQVLGSYSDFCGQASDYLELASQIMALLGIGAVDLGLLTYGSPV
jgi:hypothetical protein